jgi:hypothetical protein
MILTRQEAGRTLEWLVDLLRADLVCASLLCALGQTKGQDHLPKLALADRLEETDRPAAWPCALRWAAVESNANEGEACPREGAWPHVSNVSGNGYSRSWPGHNYDWFVAPPAYRLGTDLPHDLFDAMSSLPHDLFDAMSSLVDGPGDTCHEFQTSDHAWCALMLAWQLREQGAGVV